MLVVNTDRFAEFHDLAIPLVNNWQAREIHTGAEAREGLYHAPPGAQSGALGREHGLFGRAGRGPELYVEVGAGGVLTGLLRNINSSLTGARFNEPDDLEKL